MWPSKKFHGTPPQNVEVNQTIVCLSQEELSLNCCITAGAIETELATFFKYIF